MVGTDVWREEVKESKIHFEQKDIKRCLSLGGRRVCEY